MIGIQELIIIAVVVLLLFGTPILTFLLGFTLGRKASETPRPSAPVPSPGGGAAPTDDTSVANPDEPKGAAE